MKEVINYTAPKTEDFIQALELLINEHSYVTLNAKTQYHNSKKAHIQMIVATDSKRRYLTNNHDLYCSSFYFKEDIRFDFGIGSDSFCEMPKHINFDLFLEEDFNKSKNHKKAIFKVLSNFKKYPSFKTAKSFLILYSIKFLFSNGTFSPPSHFLTIESFNKEEQTQEKSEANKLKDELRFLFKAIKKKEQELAELQSAYNNIKQKLNC